MSSDAVTLDELSSLAKDVNRTLNSLDLDPLKRLTITPMALPQLAATDFEMELPDLNAIDLTDIDFDGGDSEELKDAADQAREALAGLIDAISELESVGEDVNDSNNVVVERLELLLQQNNESQSRIEEELRALLADELEKFMTTFEEDMLESVEQTLESASTEIHETFEINRDLAEGVVSESAARVTDLFLNAADGLGSQIGQSVVSASENMVSSFVEETMSGLVDDLVLSQVAATISSSLAPVFPQLITAKAIVSAVKKALELLRSGKL